MSVTVNSFPPFQSMNSPRGWALAIIILLHAVFFWLFASGLGSRMIGAIGHHEIEVVDVPYVKPPPTTRVQDFDVDPQIRDTIFVPEPENPLVDNPPRSDNAPTATTSEPPTHVTSQRGIEEPVVEMPSIDSRTPLSEPEYPAPEIRLNHAGTVMLSIYVLENGRVGDVRIEQSSGFPRLDTAAAREAKRWRLKPGSQDGRPMAMWKTIPITFQLKKQ